MQPKFTEFEVGENNFNDQRQESKSQHYGTL